MGTGRGGIGEAGQSPEVNSTRRKLKRAYFLQRVEEKVGDLRATWEVLGEVLRGRRGRKTGATCGYFSKDGVRVTDRGQIAGGVVTFIVRWGQI